MAKLCYQGHSSYRITSDEGTVLYVDPYAGKGYDIPGDIILVTHQHGDHNQISLVGKKKDCVIITNKEAFAGNQYQNFSLKGIQINAVPAYNKNHPREECVGFVITVEGQNIRFRRYFNNRSHENPFTRIQVGLCFTAD
jgi:L-ascorbate metabolism protein UlaG (beta-lactamase superfamily)